MHRSRPQSAQEWYDEMAARIHTDGYRTVRWSEWSTWPFRAAPGEPHDLQPLGTERPRHGADGVDCFMCTAVATDDADYVIWRDEVAMIGQPHEDIALPFAAFLMPRRHADLSDLEPHEAARMGELMVLLERAVTDVLDVPRVQFMRWGDGQEHLHWWAMGRPTGAEQLRGSFLASWDEILPPRARSDTRSDLDAVARRLVELAGGVLPGA